MQDGNVPEKWHTTVQGDGLEELMPGFLCMDTHDRGVRGYAAGWLVRGRTGNIIIESGAGAAVPRWLENLKRCGIPAESVQWILVTHVHLDHAGGAGLLLQHLPNARIGVHPEGVRHLLDPSRLLAGARLVWTDDFDLLGPMVPAPADRVVGLADNTVLDLGEGRRIRVVYTPGHTPHHISFFEESSRGIFPGDALGALFNAPHPAGEFMTMPGLAPPRADLPAYLRSVRRICALRPRRIFATHFGLWQPALPHIYGAIGQVQLIWDLCLDVADGGGGIRQARELMAEQILSARTSRVGQDELEKNFFAMLDAVWTYVESEKRADVGKIPESGGLMT